MFSKLLIAAAMLLSLSAQAAPDNRYCTAANVSTLAGLYDGPAKLPASCINTAKALTPSPLKTTVVPAGGNFQAALNAASCGDTITLAAGATYTGPFVFPARACLSSRWITVRTSSPDASLPAEGARMTPCYSNVKTLPSRPSYGCVT